MYKRILVPVDGSDASLKGLDEAIKLARPAEAALRIIHVVNELLLSQDYAPMFYHDTVINSLREGGKKILGNAEATARRQGVQVQTGLLETIGRRAADLILQDAAAWPADLIVMGTHGRRGLARITLGSDAEMVLRSAPVPVLLVRGRAKRTPE